MRKKIRGATLAHCDAGRGEIVLHPTDEDDLVQKIDALAKKYEPIVRMNYSVDLVREGEGRLSVGIGQNEWMLSSFSDDGTAQNSLGNVRAKGVAHFYFGDATAIPRKFLVPRSKAVDAVRTWWRTGELDQRIRWTDQHF
jgi:hypothetical protein